MNNKKLILIYSVLFALLVNPLFSDECADKNPAYFLELMRKELPQILDDSLNEKGLFSSVEPLEDGGPSFINSVYLINLKDDRQLILKIGNPIWKAAKTLNEVAALKFLRAHTNVPVPDVLAFQADAEASLIGYEYILMNRVKGKPFIHEFSSIYENNSRYLKILDQLASYVGELKSYKFSHLGNFKIISDDQLEVYGVVDFANYKVEGACKKYSEYAQHALQFYKQEMMHLVDKKSVDTAIYEKYIPILDDFIAKANLDCLDNDSEYVFSHQDLVMKNILIDDENVSALLDWEWSGSALSENESMTGFDFLKTEEDKSYFSKALEHHGIYHFFDSPPYPRELFYRLIGNVYTLVAFREWSEGKLEHTAKFLNQKLEQRKIRNNPDIDLDEFIKSVTLDLDKCLEEFEVL